MENRLLLKLKVDRWIPNDFVTVKGKKSYIRDDTLFLFNKRITDITNLEELLLSQNQIRELKGLENLRKLQMILLRENPIKEEEKDLIFQKAQNLVNYLTRKR